MAFDISNLTRLAGGSGVNLWHYTSADAIATVKASGYFSGEAVNMMNARDVIICVDTNTPTTHIASVLTNDGTTINTSQGTAVAETD
tara:strand:+ start:816 stop:1076 length:261 start_codon:yes stop_codon:yes gene_type:complete